MIVFKSVTAAELIKEIVLLARDIWLEHYTPILGIQQVNYMLEKFQSEEAITSDIKNGFNYFGIYIDQQLVGYFSLLVNKEEHDIFLSKIYIDKTVRGLGVGNKTLQFVEKYCKTKEISKLWLTVNKGNTSSIEWYKTRKFEITDQLKTDIGDNYYMDDYVMEKNI